MKRGLAIMLAALMVAPNLLWAQTAQKPVAALGRVATLGEISEGQKRIITARLENKLSQAYQLISQKQYRRAEEAAFAELAVDKCTQEECIRKIQEILQVERLFILQIIREQEFTQLSLTLAKGEALTVEVEKCEQCSIAQLDSGIQRIADRLIATDLPSGIPEERVSAAPAPAPAEEPEGPAPSWVAWTGWSLVGVSLLVITDARSQASDAQALADNSHANNDADAYLRAEELKEGAKSDAEFGYMLMTIGGGLLTYYWMADEAPASAARARSLTTMPIIAATHQALQVGWRLSW